MLVLLKHGAPTANVDGRASTLHDMAIQLVDRSLSKHTFLFSICNNGAVWPLE